MVDARPPPHVMEPPQPHLLTDLPHRGQLAQQLQNKQLASQIQHLQAMQHKVQEQQAAVMTAVNGSSSNSPGLVTSVTSAQAGVNSQMAQNSSNGFLVNDHR